MTAQTTKRKVRAYAGMGADGTRDRQTSEFANMRQISSNNCALSWNAGRWTMAGIRALAWYTEVNSQARVPDCGDSVICPDPPGFSAVSTGPVTC